MKKIFLYLFMFVTVLGGFMTSCGDNEDFSSIHVLTDDEIAEMEHQQHVRDSLKGVINADKIFAYTVTDYPSSSQWSSQTLEIDLEGIGEVFGLSGDEVLAGINQEDGSPEIKGFARENSTGLDKEVASNTNGIWGHWWTTEGDVCTSYDQANSAFYCEWQEDHFAVGQFPGRLTAPFSVTVYEFLRYQDKRVAIAVTYDLVERGEIKAQIVNTEKLTVNQTPRSSYDADAVVFNYEQVMADLGISSMTDVSVVGVKADGSYEQEPSANGGFWYDLDGYPGSHGENASVYVEYYGMAGDDEEELGVVHVGQMPNALAEGYTTTVKLGFLANNKIYMLEVTVNIVGYQDPETKPEGEPREVTIDKVYEVAWSSNGFNDEIDVREEIRDAFKMTTYELYKANLNGDIKMYLGEETTEAPSYTANAPGYWMNVNAESVSWGSDGFAAYTELRFKEESIKLGLGNNPGNCDPNGVEIPVKLIITCADNIGKVTINLTIKITKFTDTETVPEGEPKDVEKELTFSKAYTSGYEGLYEDVRELCKDAFKMTTYQIYQALQNGELKVYVGEVSEEEPKYTGGAAGEYWIDGEGKPCEYAAGILYLGFYTDGSEYMEIGTGNHPENCSKEGQTVKTKLILTCNGVKAVFNITVNITAAQ